MTDLATELLIWNISSISSIGRYGLDMHEQKIKVSYVRDICILSIFAIEANEFYCFMIGNIYTVCAIWDVIAYGLLWELPSSLMTLVIIKQERNCPNQIPSYEKKVAYALIIPLLSGWWWLSYFLWKMTLSHQAASFFRVWAYVLYLLDFSTYIYNIGNAVS